MKVKLLLNWAVLDENTSYYTCRIDEREQSVISRRGTKKTA